jgi:hypothetical protein
MGVVTKKLRKVVPPLASSDFVVFIALSDPSSIS